jgi:8-oxo-dGTP pyrophosphatase MutT (NUDIX family)
LPEPAAVATARDAASLIVVRPGPAVLMGLRGAGHRFMPNRLVFPGGAVDPADAEAPVAAPMRAETRTALERHATPALALALGAAAARELVEETGLSLGDPPVLDGLFYLCRAVTPPRFPIRFNARFLVVASDRVEGDIAGSGELEDVRWFEVADALALELAFVTKGVLQHLLAWLALPEPARLAIEHTPVCLDADWGLE